MKAYLETEQGDRVAQCDLADATFFLETASAETVCLRFIDPVGDTVFNRGQCRVLFVEWQQMAERCPPELQSWWECVSELIARCRDGVHLYVKFMGD